MLDLNIHPSMKLLLKKFRIPVSDVIVIPNMMTPPSADTMSWFDGLTRELVQPADSTNTNSMNSFLILEAFYDQIVVLCNETLDISEPFIQPSEMLAHKGKTLNYLRLRELLLQFSSEANLVVL